MVSTTAPILILSYVRDVLAADTVLGAMTPPPTVSVVPVAPGTAYPRVVVEAPSSGPNVNALQDGGVRIWAQPRVQISVIAGNENSDAINAIAARVETLLDGIGSQTVTGGEVVMFVQDWSVYQPALEENAYHASIIQQYSSAVSTA
jgi:hypothetical protein